MGDGPNAAATALQLDSSAAVHRFVRAISSNLGSATTLHLYEHRNATFSVHSHENVQVAATLLRSDCRAPTELPATQNNPAIETLLLDPRTARTLAVSALFSAGLKVVVWAVAADGRISSSMDGTPGCPASLTSWLGERPDEGIVIAVLPAVVKGLSVLGVAVWDPASVTLRVADVYTDDTFAALEPIFVATNARELIVPDGVPEFDRRKIDDMVEKCCLAVTMFKKKAFDRTDVATTIHRLAGSRLQEDVILDGKIATGAAGALIQYCDLAGDMLYEGRVLVRELATAGCMQLDNGVMRALNILPFPGDSGKRASLFGLLNRCKNAMGSRLLRKWLAQPLQSMEDINKRLDAVEAFGKAVDTRRAVREDHLCKLPDINLLCKRFTRSSGSNATLQDIVRLYQCSVRLPFLCDEMERDSKDSPMAQRYSQPLRKFISELRNFEALVEATVDLDQIDNGEFVVSPQVNPELKMLREQQDEILRRIHDEYKSVADSICGLKGDNLKLERKDNLGYIFRLTRKEEKLIRGNSKYHVLETRKDGVRFQTRGLRRLSESYHGIAEEYQQKEAETREKTLEVAGTYVEVFLDVAAVLAELDVICSFSAVSMESRSTYVRPVMKPPGSGLQLKQARHPIVEENMSDGMEFIANDIDLRRCGDSDNSDGKDNGGSLMLVTGPNMGGKSTYIRCAGVVCLMAHVGMFVPCSEAEVAITDRIFARVGAADNQHMAVSTFMSEMLETSSILRSATWKSLVIVDELGRGTGTTEGYGLAYSISQHIATKIRCACLFATHFYEITALADEVEYVKNSHVAAVTEGDGNGLTFLYEVRDGACDQSFGVHVAEMAHFPITVVGEAKRKAMELEGCTSASKRVKTAEVSNEAREQGRKMIMELENELRKLPLSTPEEVQRSTKKADMLRKQVIAQRNDYVTALLADGRCGTMRS